MLLSLLWLHCTRCSSRKAIDNFLRPRSVTLALYVTHGHCSMGRIDCHLLQCMLHVTCYHDSLSVYSDTDQLMSAQAPGSAVRPGSGSDQPANVSSRHQPFRHRHVPSTLFTQFLRLYSMVDYIHCVSKSSICIIQQQIYHKNPGTVFLFFFLALDLASFGFSLLPPAPVFKVEDTGCD